MAEQNEGTALMATVDDASPTAPTACAGWTTHDIVAHFAPGSKEIADLNRRKTRGVTAAAHSRLRQPRGIVSGTARRPTMRGRRRSADCKRRIVFGLLVIRRALPLLIAYFPPDHVQAAPTHTPNPSAS